MTNYSILFYSEMVTYFMNYYQNESTLHIPYDHVVMTEWYQGRRNILRKRILL